jgi:hypothetical protein
MMKFLRNILTATACAILLSASALRAQQQGADQTAAPIPAYHSPFAGATDDTNTPDTATTETTTGVRSLAGAQSLSLGLETTRSYWQPRFNVFGTADSNPQQTAGYNWGTWTSVSGGVDVYRVAGNSNLTLNYTSGGMFSTGNNASNGVVQELNFIDKFSYRRWSVSIFEQGTYLPESSDGFGGLGNAGVAQGGQANAGLALGAAQAVLTGRGQMLNNSDTAELDRFLTKRSSLSFSGGYSILHYFDGGGLLSYGVTNFRGGYNYQMTEKNTVAFAYTFTDFRYSASSVQPFSQHTVQASFGRVVNGKLAFQIGAGPQIVSSQAPIPPMATGGAVLSSNSTSTRLFWTANTSLQYQERRYGLGLSYNHSVNGGAGVLAGARSDIAAGTFTKQMSRTFASGFTGGYSRIQGLPGPGAVGNQLYEYWFGGINLTEPLSPSMALTLSYQAQYQTSNMAACVGPTCGINVLRHLISVGLGWHERPLLF